MADLIISVSGLRGIVGENLTPELAGRFACAYAAHQPAGDLVLARDGRATGEMFTDAIRAALMGVGRSVLDAGVAATPTVGVLIRHHQAAGGIQVSASHNPPPYNGIKLFSDAGCVLSAEAGEQVISSFQAGQVAWVTHDRIGRRTEILDTQSAHADLVLKTVHVESIRRCGFHALLDSNHACGSLLGRRLLSELGCRITAIGSTPDGQFAHPPEPTAENLHTVCEQVVQAKADIGFCQDPDADRLAIIDENGRYIGEEYTLALCLAQILENRRGPVVTNCSTSRMAEDLAVSHGVPFFRAPVGEANVVQLMQAKQAVFGGEGNGGPIDPQVGFIRDSFVGMACILDAMATRQMPVSQLADELPRYAIHKAKVQVERNKISAAVRALEKHFSDARPDCMDGLRLDWPDKWLLVRASNTEPIVRIVAEAETAEQAQQLCAVSAEVIAAVE